MGHHSNLGLSSHGAVANSFSHSQRVGRKGNRMETVFGLYKNCECADCRVCISFLRQIKNPILSCAWTWIVLIWFMLFLSACYVLGTMPCVYSTEQLYPVGKNTNLILPVRKGRLGQVEWTAPEVQLVREGARMWSQGVWFRSLYLSCWAVLQESVSQGPWLPTKSPVGSGNAGSSGRRVLWPSNLHLPHL